MTYDNDERQEIHARINALDPIVRDEILHQMYSLADSMTYDAEEFDTPAKQLLCIHLKKKAEIIESAYHLDCIVNSKSDVTVGSTKYDVDFFIGVQKKRETGHFGLVVECGDESPQNKKYRDIQSQGIPVLYFTESEILNNPLLCAREVKEAIISMAGFKK